jgi:hypothetical protein
LTIPEIVITDAATNLPIRVDSKNQGQRLEVIQEQMQFAEQEEEGAANVFYRFYGLFSLQNRRD